MTRQRMYTYHASDPVYAVGWSRENFQLAACSMNYGANWIQILRVEGERSEELRPTAEAGVQYAVNRVQWQPCAASLQLLATSSDALRLWELREGRLKCVQELCSKAENAAPLTSFDWNASNPALLVTSSVDTTCTVWDMNKKQAKTQLIAHDSQVFDVTWVANSGDVFASVGADGSVRMFDLRGLDHSSIIYETPATQESSLLRLAANRVDPNYLACIHHGSAQVQILDVRMPGAAISELQGHSAAVNSIEWSPNSSSQMCTASDDCQVLVWELRPSSGTAERAKSAPIGLSRDPIMAYTAPYEVNTVRWNCADKNWLALTFGRCVQLQTVK